VTLLKPVSMAFAAASLIAFVGLGPAQAQSYPSPNAATQRPGPTQLVTNGPQANVENASPNWSARENVIQSHRYERLIATSSAFREARMRKECGPITDPQLHANCIASFQNQG
jgi:hypothetical protein